MPSTRPSGTGSGTTCSWFSPIGRWLARYEPSRWSTSSDPAWTPSTASAFVDLRRVAKKRLWIGLIGTAINLVITVATLSLLVWLIASGRISPSAAGAAAGAVVLLAQRIHGLGGASGSMYENTLYMQDFTRFVDQLPELRTTRPSGPAPSGFSKLRATDIDFTYPSRDLPALRGVSIEIGHDEVVAIVGENGSGKTTLAKLLAGLYPPSSGTICWDETDISESDPDLLRRSVALIFQEFGQYYMTAGENIGLGDVRTHQRQRRHQGGGTAGPGGQVHRRTPQGLRQPARSRVLQRSQPVSGTVATDRARPGLLPRCSIRHPGRANRVPRSTSRGCPVRERSQPLPRSCRAPHLASLLECPIRRPDLRDGLRTGR